MVPDTFNAKTGRWVSYFKIEGKGHHTLSGRRGTICLHGVILIVRIKRLIRFTQDASTHFLIFKNL